MNKSEHTPAALYSNEKSINLAEILANFALRRPLHFNESSALCYQLLEEFHSHLSNGNTNETLVLNLTYPTLGNIQIEENGYAFVTKTQFTKYKASDWLIVFAETLKRHTLWDQSLESSTFRTLVDNLASNCHLTYHPLVEKIQIWRNTCLYLCSAAHIAGKMTEKLLLKELRTRSGHAQSFKLFSHEIQERNLKHPKSRSNLWSTLDNNTKPILIGNVIRPQVQKNYVQEEKEAFVSWVEKWRCVNAEFSAHQVIGNQLVHKISDRLEPRYHRQLWSYKLPPSTDSSMKNHRSSEDSKHEPIKNDLVDLETGIPKQAESNDLNPSTYMDTLRNMYSTLICRPLNLMKKGFRESSIGIKAGTIHKNTNSTLKELEQVLQKSNSG